MTALRIRVELDHITPVIWREIEVPADLPLPALHLVLQEAMGWQNMHLHGFRRLASAFQEAQIWSSDPEMLTSAGFGGPTVREESAATVTDLLGGVGGQGIYDYDFGDDWEHTLTVLALGESNESEQPQARVLAGERACPPENCGGPPGYQSLVDTAQRLAQDANADVEPWQSEALALMFDRREPRQILSGLELFDVVDADHGVRSVTAPVPQMCADLAAAVETSQAVGSSRIIRMVQAARLDEAVEPDGATCAAMMAPLLWFLGYVGAEGLRLTSAGYLRPDDVSAVAEQLDIGKEWYGKLNRESQTLPVLDFRETVRDLGLARKAKGQITLTAAGRRLQDDPVGLWRHVADRLPLGRNEFAKVAGLIAMLDVASRPVSDAAASQRDRGSGDVSREPASTATPDPMEVWRREKDEQDAIDVGLAAAVADLGWRTDDGPVPGGQVRQEARSTVTLLGRCGVMPRRRWEVHWSPTAPGLQFLRAALRG